MTWLDPASGREHAYNWALLAASNIRDAAIETGCPHAIRLSGKLLKRHFAPGLRRAQRCEQLGVC
jgi:hypothetical protein